MEAAVRDIVMILLILVLIALLCIYLHISLSWHSIDIISLDAEEYIREKLDPAFDTERFREYINKLLKKIEFLDENSVIFFTPFYDRKRSQNSLNAHTGLPGQKVIIFTPGWAARLYRESFARNSDGAITDLFAFVLGHEMTHKEQHKPIFLFGRKRVCACWLREISSDFGGMRKSRLTAKRVKFCLEKEILNREGRRDRRYGSETVLRPHPTWEYRMKCWKTGRMTRELVDQICRDCGVTDRRFCNKMRRIYVEKAAGSVKKVS